MNLNWKLAFLPPELVRHVMLHELVHTLQLDHSPRFRALLAAREIGTGRHYPEPPHLSEAYATLGHREGAFPVAETISREGLSLPMFPGISDGQLQRVVDAITDYF